MSRRVLVIDDETNIRRMMRLTLESDGYEVEDAEDGEKGLALFGDGSGFDAVLLDQKMPGVDGIETLRRIRQRSPGARVVMITAFGTVELAVEAMKAGATDFLRKPLTPDTLRGALAAVLSKAPTVVHPERAAAMPTAPKELPPVEVWTVNGFFIRSKPRPEGAPVDEHLFEIRHATRGPQGEVIVTVDQKEAARVARITQRRLPVTGAFWHQRAERAVVDYLFRQAALPPDNRLVVSHLQDDAVRLAAEWTKD
jgi:DNA-binding response OmpR family regulator